MMPALNETVPLRAGRAHRNDGQRLVTFGRMRGSARFWSPDSHTFATARINGVYRGNETIRGHAIGAFISMRLSNCGCGNDPKSERDPFVCRRYAVRKRDPALSRRDSETDKLPSLFHWSGRSPEFHPICPGIRFSLPVMSDIRPTSPLLSTTATDLPSGLATGLRPSPAEIAAPPRRSYLRRRAPCERKT